jgi:hypothetical protein
VRDGGPAGRKLPCFTSHWASGPSAACPVFTTHSRAALFCVRSVPFRRLCRPEHGSVYLPGPRPEHCSCILLFLLLLYCKLYASQLWCWTSLCDCACGPLPSPPPLICAGLALLMGAGAQHQRRSWPLRATGVPILTLQGRWYDTCIKSDGICNRNRQRRIFFHHTSNAHCV